MSLDYDTAADSWRTRTLDDAGAGQSRLGFAGGQLIAARDDGVLAVFALPADLGTVGPGTGREIHRETQKLRGAVLADLDPASPGLEAATAGYGQVANASMSAMASAALPRALS